MSKGKLIAEGSIEQLSKKAGGGKVLIEVQLAEVNPGRCMMQLKGSKGH